MDVGPNVLSAAATVKLSIIVNSRTTKDEGSHGK